MISLSLMVGEGPDTQAHAIALALAERWRDQGHGFVCIFFYKQGVTVVQSPLLDRWEALAGDALLFCSAACSRRSLSPERQAGLAVWYDHALQSDRVLTL